RHSTLRSLIAKVKEARLSAGVRFDLERVGIQPRDPQARWNRHESRGSVGLALLTGGFVFCRVPVVARLLGFERNGNARVVTLRRGNQATKPAIGDPRD